MLLKWPTPHINPCDLYKVAVAAAVVAVETAAKNVIPTSAQRVVVKAAKQMQVVAKTLAAASQRKTSGVRSLVTSRVEIAAAEIKAAATVEAKAAIEAVVLIEVAQILELNNKIA